MVVVHSFPLGLYPAGIQERKRFYETEFDAEKAFKWASFIKAPVFSIDVGTETTLYNPLYKKYLKKLILIRDADSQILSSKLIQYTPEDVYYNISESENEKQKKELVFDMDPENIRCLNCEEKRKKAHLTFCERCFEALALKTMELYKLMRKHFRLVYILYSGRGFHIHVRDKEAFELEEEYRLSLTEKVKEAFPIDPWVTTKENKIRLPGTLNALVSRKVIFVTVNDLKDPAAIYRKRAMPQYLKAKSIVKSENQK